MDKSRGSSPGAVVGIIVAVLVGVVAVGVCAFLLWRYLASRNLKRTHVVNGRSYSLPVRAHGMNTSMELSDQGLVHQELHHFPLHFGPFSFWGHRMEESPSAEKRIVQFTYKQLQKATKNFTTVVGKGAFGPVYKAILPNTSVLAVKVLATNSKQGEKEFQNEVMLLSRLHHRNLLNLVGCCSEGGHKLLAYEYMANRSLNLRLHDERYQVLSWNQRVSIAQDVAKGIEYLHDGAVPPVIHRDIKSSNILLDSFMAAKIADFGLSKVADASIPASGIKGTYGYVDPEYISTNSLTYKSDVYSFGVLLFELIAARSPIEGLMEYVELTKMSDGGGEAWLQILDPLLEGDCDVKELGEMAFIATKCTDNEARRRPNIQEVTRALSRLGPRSESIRLDFQEAPLIRKVDQLDRTEKVVLRASTYNGR